MEIKVAVSIRHVHLTKEDHQILFGDEELVKAFDIMQYGQYASTSFVTIKTPHNTLPEVRILGPLRDYTQIEISRTDAYYLGLNPPVRDSGDVEGSDPITIIGPKGTVYKDSGCIIANRHIHLHTKDDGKFGLHNNQRVSVKLFGEKGGIIDNVQVKTGNYFCELHIDTDDANAHLLQDGDTVDVLID